jgi:uncharacterized membrane protein
MQRFEPGRAVIVMDRPAWGPISKHETMGKGRLEAFSDGVLAIVITIMVLGLQVPASADLAALKPVVPSLMTYVLSFVYVGIYWNNHHHMLQAARRVSGRVLWANLGLLFWLSLFPFATGWMGQNHFEGLPAAVYGFVLLMAAVAYWVLQQSIIAANGPDSVLKHAIGGDWKGKASPLLYAIGIAAAFWIPSVSQAIYVAVALIWLVPDRRIELEIDRDEA